MDESSANSNEKSSAPEQEEIKPVVAGEKEIKAENDAMEVDRSSSPHPPTNATTANTVPPSMDTTTTNVVAPSTTNAETVNNTTEATVSPLGKEKSETPQAHFLSRQPSTGPYYGDDIGAPTRVWLNENVTPALVVAMRRLALERPGDPLRTLGQWLIEAADNEKRSN
ncbi:COMPASS component Sdc1p [Trichomonascus vanleenenianus]|uniref:Sdc1p n=1 Tax=Trichomonascus vanleenenianus TaxID=2268995 RepID=UPI003ECA8C50